MPDPVVDVTSESSPLTESVTPPQTPIVPSLASLTPEQRQTWRQTGDYPTPAAASSAATEAATPPASTDATLEADSEPAEPESETEVTYKARTERRFTELLEKNRQLESRLEALQRPKPDVVDSSPAAADDPEPDADAYDDLTKWVREHGAWAARAALREAHAKTAAATRTANAQAETQQMQQAWDARVSAAVTKYPDFNRAAIEAAIPAKSIVDAFVLDASADDAAAILYHFQKTPTDLPRVLNLPPMAQLEALVLIKQAATRAPVVKRHTTAPDAPPTLGTRGTAPDPIVSAVKAGDQRAYRDEMNRRDLAARKGL